MTTEVKLERVLVDVLNHLPNMDPRALDDLAAAGLDDLANLAEDILQADSFKNCGVVSYNEGVVISMEDGSEFQLTIVQSKYGR